MNYMAKLVALDGATLVFPVQENMLSGAIIHIPFETPDGPGYRSYRHDESIQKLPLPGEITFLMFHEFKTELPYAPNQSPSEDPGP